MKNNHSGNSFTEKASEVVVNARVQIENYTYKSNWIVSNCRDYILLGMPWHIENKPRNSYKSGTLKVGEMTLLTVMESSNSRVKIQNLGVKKLCSLLQKKHKNNDFSCFRLEW